MYGYVVKYTDGSYEMDDLNNKGTWQQAKLYATYAEANDFVETMKSNKANFLKNNIGYVAGLKPEFFDCKVVKRTIAEEEAVCEGVSEMLHLKCHFANGDSFSTKMNATIAEAEQYYVGNTFNLGIGFMDNMQVCVSIEMITP